MRRRKTSLTRLVGFIEIEHQIKQIVHKSLKLHSFRTVLYHYMHKREYSTSATLVHRHSHTFFHKTSEIFDFFDMNAVYAVINSHIF